jgi:hypothetical protein
MFLLNNINKAKEKIVGVAKGFNDKIMDEYNKVV